MATYKVIQDIEAEDKLLGPLTFRQFVYGLVCAGFLFLSWFVASRGAAFMLAFFLPPAVVAGFFAFPWGRDQPTELWALAKIRFMLKPRRRIWDQSGVKELVTITAPKRVQTALTDNLSQAEVKSRLRALADTIDTRGWAIKSAVGSPQPTLAVAAPSAYDTSDRLVSATPLQPPPAADDLPASEDMFDEQNNVRAKRVGNLVDASSKARRQKVIDEINQSPKRRPAQPANNYWFLNQPSGGGSVPANMVTFNTQVVTPGTVATSSQPAASAPNEAALLKELEAHKEESPMKSYYAHMKKILPPEEQEKERKRAAQKQAAAKAQQARAAAAKQHAPEQPSPKHQAALRQLAGNNDLNVATIAREAKRSSGEMQDEVVISLH